MAFGSTRTVKVVSDGTFLIEGGIIFGKKERPIWEMMKRPDRKNRVRAGLNCLIITDKQQNANLLINSGMGNRYPAEMRDRFGRTASKLNANLRNVAKLNPREITHVYFTSMHYHNSGGALRLNKDGDLTLNFPKAVHIVHRKSWEEAMSPSMLHENDLYGPDPKKFREDIQILVEKGKLLLIDEPEYEIIPGVLAEEVGGYGEGHSIVKVNAGSDRFMYSANLFPTQFHLETPVLTAYDRKPEESMAQKLRFVQEARQEGYIVIFAGDHEYPVGYIMGDKKIRPIDL